MNIHNYSINAYMGYKYDHYNGIEDVACDNYTPYNFFYFNPGNIENFSDISIKFSNKDIEISRLREEINEKQEQINTLELKLQSFKDKQ